MNNLSLSYVNKRTILHLEYSIRFLSATLCAQDIYTALLPPRTSLLFIRQSRLYIHLRNTMLTLTPWHGIRLALDIHLDIMFDEQDNQGRKSALLRHVDLLLASVSAFFMFGHLCFI